MWYYYAECAVFMQKHMGKVVTKFDVASIACKAYLKAASPLNIISAFKKAGIFPLNRSAIASEKLLPCEPFRDDTPLQKADAMRGGKDAILDYLKNKVAQTSVTSECCPCKLKTRRRSRPNPSGREITDDQFMAEMDQLEKENSSPKPRKKRKEARTEEESANHDIAVYKWQYLRRFGV
ncbi:hypothetical protein DPMN_173973 [Dreissena polymorpha]|uniref:Uncharacterized protein n=1 Tax=Dreissena polymorpha TaxID=45954 RepID=A0A9D4E2K6_DREPO|nr:hypothetical protein DPMN_173973 [Dreissena polymorpha]